MDCAMAWSPVEQGRGPADLSGGDRQGLQPFEPGDFLAKAAHARAVVGLQPHRDREIALQGGAVPARMIGGRECP